MYERTEHFAMFPREQPKDQTTSLSVRIQSSNEAVYGPGALIIAILEHATVYPNVPMLVVVRKDSYVRNLVAALEYYLPKHNVRRKPLGFDFAHLRESVEAIGPETVVVASYSGWRKGLNVASSGIVFWHMDNCTIHNQGPFVGLPNLIDRPLTADSVNQMRTRFRWHCHLVLCVTLHNSRLKPDYAAQQHWLDRIDALFPVAWMVKPRREWYRKDPFLNMDHDGGTIGRAADLAPQREA